MCFPEKHDPQKSIWSYEFIFKIISTIAATSTCETVNSDY